MWIVKFTIWWAEHSKNPLLFSKTCCQDAQHIAVILSGTLSYRNCQHTVAWVESPCKPSWGMQSLARWGLTFNKQHGVDGRQMSQTSTFCKFQVTHSIIIIIWELLPVFDYYMTGRYCIFKNNIISLKNYICQSSKICVQKSSCH